MHGPSSYADELWVQRSAHKIEWPPERNVVCMSLISLRQEEDKKKRRRVYGVVHCIALLGGWLLSLGSREVLHHPAKEEMIGAGGEERTGPIIRYFLFIIYLLYSGVKQHHIKLYMSKVSWNLSQFSSTAHSAVHSPPVSTVRPARLVGR